MKSRPFREAFRIKAKERVTSYRFAKFVNKRKYIAGICFILFWVFSESLPFGAKIADVPKTFTVNFFLMPFPFIKEAPMLYLLIPSLIFLSIAFFPVFERNINYLSILLIIIGLSFFPIACIFGGYFLLWAVPFASWLGINHWIRSLDYFYSSAIAGLMWDLGGAVLPLLYGMQTIGVPYHPGLPPITIIFIDVSLIAVFSVLWWKKGWIAGKAKWKLLRYYE